MAAVTQMKMAHDRDPKKVIREDVGDVTGYEVFHSQVLCGIYERPEKTAGGIILAPTTKREDLFQGVVGLVLKVGPGAFVDDQLNKFHGMSVKEGDWVVFRTSDGWKTAINGKHCSLLEDAHIKARIQHPDQVY